jgi:hypothetical protein
MQVKIYALFIEGENETVICYIEVPFKAGLPVYKINTVFASFHLVALKNIVEDFKSQHPCWSSGMKNKGWGHNFGI